MKLIHMWLDMTMKKGPRLDLFDFVLYSNRVYHMENMDASSCIVNMLIIVIFLINNEKNLSHDRFFSIWSM